MQFSVITIVCVFVIQIILRDYAAAECEIYSHLCKCLHKQSQRSRHRDTSRQNIVLSLWIAPFKTDTFTVCMLKMGNSRYLFRYLCVFDNLKVNKLLMARFEPETSWVCSNHFAHCTATTVQSSRFFKILQLHSQVQIGTEDYNKKLLLPLLVNFSQQID